MRMLTIVRSAMGAALASIGVLGVGVISTVGIGTAGATTAPQVVGHVYVDDNTEGTNTVAAFDRYADGSLSAVPGSPFVTGGAGTGSGIASQGALQRSSDGRYLVAADAGSNQVSVLQIKPDGGLRLLHDGVVSSGGSTPVSVAVHGGLVYVANAGTDDSNLTGFTLNPGGQLRPLADSTVSLASNAQPGDVLFNPAGTNLIATLVGTSTIASFVVGGDGLLTSAAGSPFPAQGAGPFGSEFRPTDASQLFVSNAHNGGSDLGSISAFSVAGDGSLSSIGTSPFGDQQNAPCWVEISHDGRFLFTVNTGSGSISRYSIADNGTLTLLGSTTVGATGGVGAVDARLSPDGRFLFVDESRIGTVGALAVDGGALTELSSSPTALPAGATPAGIVVD
jgi:6-phosphogluconolactonase